MNIKRHLNEYACKGLKRWHTPGHKGTLDKLDLTEVGDNGCIFPSNDIESAQEKAAKFFGAKHCRFLVNGSSSGIKAAILSVGGDVIAPRARHRCVDEGAELARVSVHELKCGKLGDGYDAPPSVSDVERAIKEYPQARAVLVVSPDYYGVTASIEIAAAVHGNGKILITDAAHGAHFATRPDLFRGFQNIADFCVMSAHKTMHAYTQSAYLCVNNDSLLCKTDKSLRLIGTTSPSYRLLSGLEEAVEYAEKNKYGYDDILTAVEEFKREISCRHSDDFTRIVVDANAYGMSGGELFDKLFENGHAAEVFDSRYVVFIATLDDTAADIEELKECIKRLT